MCRVFSQCRRITWSTCCKIFSLTSFSKITSHSKILVRFHYLHKSMPIRSKTLSNQSDINLKYRDYDTQLPCIKKIKRNRENNWLIHVYSIYRSRQGNTLNFCNYWNWHNFSKNIITNIFPSLCLFLKKMQYVFVVTIVIFNST